MGFRYRQDVSRWLVAVNVSCTGRLSLSSAAWFIVPFLCLIMSLGCDLASSVLLMVFSGSVSHRRGCFEATEKCSPDETWTALALCVLSSTFSGRVLGTSAAVSVSFTESPQQQSSSVTANTHRVLFDLRSPTAFWAPSSSRWSPPNNLCPDQSAPCKVSGVCGCCIHLHAAEW